MTERLLKIYRIYHRAIRRMLLFGGCLHSPTVSSTVSYCSASFAMFTLSTQTLNVFNFCYDHRNDLAIVMKSFGRAASSLMILLKAGCFLWHRNYLIELQLMLDDLFEKELARSEEIRAVMFSDFGEFWIPAYIYPIIVAVTLMVFVCPVLVRIIRQIINLQAPSNYGMPYLSKYPWKIPDNFLYHVHFFYENCIGWFFMFTTCGVDEAFGLYSYQISSILRAISFRLANPLPEDRFLGLLKESIEKHKRLLRCREYLERVYGPIILWMVLTNAVLMCSLIYEAVPFTDFTFGKFMMLISYFSLKVMQTLMYGWYGTTITSGSESFREGVYYSKWPDAVGNPHVKPLVILTMMQKPMAIKALQICSLSVQLFVSVLNTTISYFFLLQTIQERG